MGTQHSVSFKATLLDPLDFIITAGASEEFHWWVHSEVLSKHSGFFKTLVQSNFKECSEKKISLPDDDPVCIARMIIFIYYGSILSCYDQRSSMPSRTSTPTIAEMLGRTHAQCAEVVYAMENMFGISAAGSFPHSFWRG